MSGAATASKPRGQEHRSHRTLLLIALVAMAPVVASYTIYYFFPRTTLANYGELLPTRPAPVITGSTADGDDELVRLPWVGHKSRGWEPEPLRWLGVNGTRIAAARSDKAELRTDRPSRLWGGVIDAVLGKH